MLSWDGVGALVGWLVVGVEGIPCSRSRLWVNRSWKKGRQGKTLFRGLWHSWRSFLEH